MNQPEDMPSAGNMEEWLKWAETNINSVPGRVVLLEAAGVRVHGGSVGVLSRVPRAVWGMIAVVRQRDQLEVQQSDAEAAPDSVPAASRSTGERQALVWMAYSEDYRDAGEVQFDTVVQSDIYHQSSFRAAFPVRMFAGAPERFVELVKRFAARLPFDFGYAGFSFSESQEIKRKQVNEVYLLPAAMRFSGVEVESHGSTCLCCTDTIKGVNWLTLLSSPFVEKLGGKRALDPLVEDGITLHDLPTGLHPSGTGAGVGVT